MLEQLLKYARWTGLAASLFLTSGCEEQCNLDLQCDEGMYCIDNTCTLDSAIELCDPAPNCEEDNCRLYDSFDGDSLDLCRWRTVNRPLVHNGSAHLES